MFISKEEKYVKRFFKKNDIDKNVITHLNYILIGNDIKMSFLLQDTVYLIEDTLKNSHYKFIRTNIKNLLPFPNNSITFRHTESYNKELIRYIDYIYKDFIIEVDYDLTCFSQYSIDYKELNGSKVHDAGIYTIIQKPSLNDYVLIYEDQKYIMRFDNCLDYKTIYIYNDNFKSLSCRPLLEHIKKYLKDIIFNGDDESIGNHKKLMNLLK